MAKLRRVLGLFELTLVGIGIILGAGIYALIGKATGIAGNAVWISFFLAAIVAALSGLSYAELSSMFPKAGAEYVYTREGFGKKTAWFTGWLIIFAGVIAATTVSLGFAGYLNALFGTPIIMTAIILIILLSLINFWGVKQSTTLAIIFSIIESLGLVLIIFIGIPYFGSVNYLEVQSVAGIFSAAALIFFAFIGFEELVRLAEETKSARKNMPKALVLAIIFTTIIYVLVSISAVSVVSWKDLSTSASPLADVASVRFGNEGSLILSTIALFATFNTALLVLLAASRIAYGMASSGTLPKIFSRVHPKTRTPGMAIAAVGIAAVFFTFIGGVEDVAFLADFLIFVTFIVVNFALIELRYKEPHAKREFKVPLNIGKFPVLAFLGIVTTTILLLSVKLEVILYGIGVLFAGAVVYWIYFRKF